MQPELTGRYFLAISIAFMFAVVADFGITPVIIREIAKTPDKTVGLLQRVLVIKIPLLFLGYLCSISATLLLGYDFNLFVLTAMAALSITLDSVHLLFYGVLRGHHQLRSESIGMFFGQMFTAVIGGLVLWLSPSTLLLICSMMAGSLFNVLYSSWILWKQFGHSIFYPIRDAQLIKKILRMAIPFALAAIFVKIYSYVDTLFISKYLDITAVGLYSIAYKFTYAFQFIPLAFTAALYPNLSQALQQDQQHLPHLFRRALWYMMILSTPIAFGLWLVASHAVLLAGDAYAAAAPVLSVLVFVLIPIFLDFPVGSLLNAANRQTVKTTIMGITMILNIVLNALLIPSIGMMGAASAALISFSFMFLSGFWFVHQIIPTFSLKLFLMDAMRIIACGGMMIIVGRWIMPSMGWIATVAFCVLIYGCGLFITRVVTPNDFRSLKRSYDS